MPVVYRPLFFFREWYHQVQYFVALLTFGIWRANAGFLALSSAPNSAIVLSIISTLLAIASIASGTHYAIKHRFLRARHLFHPRAIVSWFTFVLYGKEQTSHREIRMHISQQLQQWVFTSRTCDSLPFLFHSHQHCFCGPWWILLWCSHCTHSQGIGQHHSASLWLFCYCLWYYWWLLQYFSSGIFSESHM